MQLIGSHQPTAGFAFPACLVVTLESRNLENDACSLASTSATPLLLPAPTRRHMRPDALRVLESQHCALLLLEKSLTAAVPRS